MSHGARGLIFIIDQRHEAWKARADAEARAMYKRPLAEPLPPTPEPERSGRWLRLPFSFRRGRISAQP